MNDLQETSKALSKLLSSYPQFTANEDALSAYFEAVSDYKVEDLQAAVKEFLAGKVEDFNPSYAPSAPLVGSVTRAKYLERLKEESSARKAALPPPKPEPEITPEERERRRQFIARLAAENPMLRSIVTAGDDPEARDD